MIRTFKFWNWSSWALTSAIELSVGSPWSFVALGVQAAFVAGLVLGYCLVEKP